MLHLQKILSKWSPCCTSQSRVTVLTNFQSVPYREQMPLAVRATASLAAWSGSVSVVSKAPQPVHPGFLCLLFTLTPKLSRQAWLAQPSED